MSDFTRWVQSQLKSGYTLAPRSSGGGYGILYRLSGVPSLWVTTGNGQPLKVSDDNSYHNRRRVIQQLREAGAVVPPQKHGTARTKARPVNPDPKTALVMAQEILRDPKSTPRERKMARAFQDLQLAHAEVVKLARHLGTVIKELEDKDH